MSKYDESIFDDCEGEELSPRQCIEQMIEDAQRESTDPVDQLTSICQTIGYRTEAFGTGDPIEKFLRDNPGAVQAIQGFMLRNADAWIDNFAPRTA